MWRSGGSDHMMLGSQIYLEGRAKIQMCTAKEKSQGQFQDLDPENGKGQISSPTGMRKTMEGIF